LHSVDNVQQSHDCLLSRLSRRDTPTAGELPRALLNFAKRALP
jgi:hypothetical protein